MTDFAPTGLTLIEVVKRHDPNGDMATIVDALMQQNDILQDAVWREANDRFGNKATRWAKEPSGTWRKLTSGVAKERGETVEMYDTIGMLDTISKSDIEIINAFRNPKQARNDEAMAFIRGLGKTMASTMIYGSTATDPEKFNGLAIRMDAIAATANVINEGGTGSDLCSIFVVDWGVDTVHMLYPLNSKAGLEHTDMGVQLVAATSTTDYRAYVDYFSWKAGLAVKNPKSVGRIANIESTGTTNIFDEDNLITLLNRMTKGPGRRIYCNQTVLTQMEIRAKDKTNINYTKADGIAPGMNLFFKGVPIRQVDQIVITEAALS